MPLTTIYLVRHGFRLNWTVDPHTGTYSATHSSPTGIPSDPPLAAHGVAQSEQLSTYLQSLSLTSESPQITRIYSSPFYRCLQTLAPYISTLPISQRVVHGDNGLGEWYGRARFTHPSPAPPAELHDLFNFYDPTDQPTIIPSTQGETIEELHDRCAYAMARIIAAEDKMDRDRGVYGDCHGEKAILICTHAASMIAIGRALTGRMPEDVCEDDFGTFTCGVSKFRRRLDGWKEDGGADIGRIGKWEAGMPVPRLEWRNAKGVGGGWNCEVNCYCGHLKDGKERGWHFQGDEAFDERDSPPESGGFKL